MRMASISNTSESLTTIAGWRIVRILGDPDADGIIQAIGVSEQALGDSADGSAHWAGANSSTRATSSAYRALIHIASNEQSTDALVAEAQARITVAGDFVDQWLDLIRDGSHTIAVQDLREMRTFADLIRSGQQLRPGQVVTLLAPLIETIQRAIASGVIPTNLQLRQCLVDRQGRPSFSCWRGTQSVSECPTMRADLLRQQLGHAIHRITTAVLAQVNAGNPAAINEAFDPLGRGRLSEAALEQCLDALYSWTAPESVSFQDLSSEPSRIAPTDTRSAFPKGGEEPPTKKSAQRPALIRSVSLQQHVLWFAIRQFVASVRPALWLSLAGVGAVVGLTGMIA